MCQAFTGMTVFCHSVLCMKDQSVCLFLTPLRCPKPIRSSVSPERAGDDFFAEVNRTCDIDFADPVLYPSSLPSDF